jgi:aryl-alcohol dehydrogenase-like predicted oxidoreductase
MQYRPLGSTGLQVSLLGLGTVKLGRDQRVKYPTSFQIPGPRAAADLLACARELGINLIDTAPAYGGSETRLGKLLADQRDAWLISTKVGETFVAGRSRYDFSPEHVQASVRGSLQRLRTTHLDIVLIHSDGKDLEILNRLGTLEALQALKQQGLLRAIGISHKTVAGAERAIELGCDVIMATLSLSEQSEAPIIAAAGRAGCGVLIKKPLASGHAGTASLQFVAAQPGVSSLIVGTINPAHLRENAAVLASAVGGVSDPAESARQSPSSSSLRPGSEL